MSDTVMGRDQIESMIIAKVAEEPAFAERLKADPKAALSEMFDTKLPPGLNVHVFQETPSDLMIRLPVVLSDEVSEDELEGVAGGACTPLLKKVAIVGAKVLARGAAGGAASYASYAIPSVKKW